MNEMTDDEIRSELKSAEAALARNPDSPYHLVLKAILIQSRNEVSGTALDDARDCLLRAHAIDTSFLPALEELAHFFCEVQPDRDQARHFALLALKSAENSSYDMRRILEQTVGD